MKLDNIILAASGILAIVISILDLLGLLDGIKFISDRVPIMTLLLVGVLITHIVFNRREKLEGLEKTIIQTQEMIINVEKNILSKPYQGVEFFDTSDKLLTRIMESTIGATRVSTLNLSLPKGKNTLLDKYFSNVDKYISQKNTSLESFRTIASVDSLDKAKWILERTADLLDTDKFSSAFFPIDKAMKFPIVGFHVIYRKNETPYIFIFPPINPSGVMNGFLIRNIEVSEVMLKYFDSMWQYSHVMLTGGVVNKNEVKKITILDEELKKTDAYKKLVLS